MDLWHKLLEALVLGIVQGLTEFLPVSSTAHLRIVPALLGWSDPGPAYTAVIQLGTLAAVLAYFRRDVWQIASAWTGETLRGQFCHSHEGKMGWMMIAGTIPIVVCGLAFEHFIETKARSLYIIAAALIGLALVLVLAELLLRQRQASGKRLIEMNSIGWPEALIVGMAQALALVPGMSRSGSTISAGLFCRLSREAAARFSFLLSLPAVFAAGIYKVLKNHDVLLGKRDDVLSVVLCTVVSGIVGYAAIAWLLAYLRTRSMYVFVAYRILLGVLLIWLLLSGHLMPDAGAEPAAKPRAAVAMVAR